MTERRCFWRPSGNLVAVPAPLHVHDYDHAQPHGYDYVQRHDCGSDACSAADGDVGGVGDVDDAAAAEKTLATGCDALNP